MADDDISKMDIGQLFSDNPLMESENKYFYEALKSMYSDEKTKTHIPPNEVKLLLQILFYRNMIKEYDKSGVKAINDMLNTYYKYMISKGRLGRKEFFNALIHRGEEPKRSFLDKLRGNNEL